MKIGFMADSGADIMKEEIERLDIRWLPVEIIYPSGKVIRDTADIDIDRFYDQMKEEPEGRFFSNKLRPEEIAEAADDLLKRNDYVLYIVMSSKMSGTYESAIMAKEMIGSRLIVFDSKSISTGQAALSLKAFEDIRQGRVDIDHLEDYLMGLRRRLQFYFVLETLEYLMKGGRIGKAQYLVGTMLKIKPGLGVDGSGEIYSVEKIRGGKKRIIKFFENLLRKYSPNVEEFPLQFVYGISTDWDMTFQRWLDEHGYIYSVRRTRPTTTIHGGPYSLGLAWFT